MLDLSGISMTGDARLQAILRAIERRGANVAPVFRGPIDKSVTRLFQRQWSTKGAFGGQRWADLRPATKAARVRRGGNRGGISHPLWDTAEMKGSFEKVGPNSYRTITRSTYARGSILFKSALAQEGFTAREWGGSLFHFPRRVAPRPPVPDPIPIEVLRVWEIFILRHLEAGLNG